MAETAELLKTPTVARTSVKASPPAPAKKASVAAQVATKLVPTIGNMIDTVHALREEKRALEAEIKVIEGKYTAMEEQIMQRFEEQGIDASRGSAASCSISTSVVGNSTDWEAFCAFVKKKNYFHLLQRRMSDPALRELWEQNVTIPGVEKFMKKKLNVRSL